jgi:hypothetical protein
MCLIGVYVYFENHGLIWATIVKGYISSKSNFCCCIVDTVTRVTCLTIFRVKIIMIYDFIKYFKILLNFIINDFQLYMALYNYKHRNFQSHTSFYDSWNYMCSFISVLSDSHTIHMAVQVTYRSDPCVYILHSLS